MSFLKKTLSIAKHYSTQALVLAGSIPSVWLSIPDEVKAIIPADKMAIATAVVALAGLAGKFVKQGNPEEKAAGRIIDEIKPVIVDQLKTRAVNTVKKELQKAMKQDVED